MKSVNRLMQTVLSAMLLVFVACSTDEEIEIQDKDAQGWHTVKACFNVTRTDFDGDSMNKTRGVEDGWKEGDRIFLLFHKPDGSKAEGYVDYDAEKGEWKEVSVQALISELTCENSRVVEAYFFDGKYSENGTSVTFDENTGVYQHTTGSYTCPQQGNLTVNVSLKPLTSRIRFTGDIGFESVVFGIKTYTSFSRETGSFSENTSPVTVKVQSHGYTPYIYAVFKDSSKKKLEISNGGYTFNTTFETTTSVLKVGRSGYLKLPTEASHYGWNQFIEYADLGLPSGIKWAAYNVGATKPEEYGNCYAWGETEPKSSYTEENYIYKNNPSVLPLDKDAAHVNWGDDWRMPNKTEQHELCNNCTWTWTTRNGVKGYMVTSTVNGNFIFLPAAGYRSNSNLESPGSIGSYWSSSGEGEKDADNLYFHSFVYYINSNSDGRYRGRSVRAVCP